MKKTLKEQIGDMSGSGQEVIDRSQCRIFMTGAGGVGKSTNINEIVKHMNPVVLSSTGVSAALIGGQTIHSFFRLGICNTIAEVKANDVHMMQKFGIANIHEFLAKMQKSIRDTPLIIIDEVSMVNDQLMNMIQYRLDQAGCPNKPLLFSGDLLQLPPVKGDMLLKNKYFKEFSPLLLEKIWRTTDLEFIDQLNKIRGGEVDLDYLEKFNVDMPFDDPLYARLYATNAEASALNNQKLKALDGDMNTYFPEIIPGSKNPYEAEIKTIYKNYRIQDPLKLKIGARILVTANMKNEDGVKIVNGDLGTIKEMYDNRIIVYIDRLDITIGIDPFISEKVVFDDGVRVVEYGIRHIPVMLAWGITIHKSQGMSIDKLFIDASNIFAPSQFYVAISRARDPEHLKIHYGSSDYEVGRSIRAISRVNIEALDYYKSIKEDENLIMLDDDVDIMSVVRKMIGEVL